MQIPSETVQRSRVIEKTPFYYGWVILVVGALGIIMSSPGQTYSFSIFIEEFIRDLGLSRSLVSGVYTVGTISGSLALPYIGRLIDKHGSRRMVLVIALAFGLACLFMGTVRNVVMLVAGIVAMRMLGQSSMVIVSRNVINQWWMQRRGFVLGISTLISSVLGTGLFPNFINFLIPRFGWRASYFILGGVVMGVMLPIGYLFFRDRPELYGLKPDGNYSPKLPQTNVVTTTIAPPTNPEPPEENWTAKEAMGTAAFWLILAGIGAFSMLITGLTFHIVSIFADNGLSSAMAAAVFLPMSITTSSLGIPGGWLTDKIESKYILSFGLVMLVITILFSAAIASPQLAILYGVTMGITNASVQVVGNVIWANYFGRLHLGQISGITATFGAAASGIGPLVYGVGRDLAGSYWPSLWLSALIPGALAVLVLFMKRPQKLPIAN